MVPCVLCCVIIDWIATLLKRMFVEEVRWGPSQNTRTCIVCIIICIESKSFCLATSYTGLLLCFTRKLLSTKQWSYLYFRLHPRDRPDDWGSASLGSNHDVFMKRAQVSYKWNTKTCTCKINKTDPCTHTTEYNYIFPPEECSSCFHYPSALNFPSFHPLLSASSWRLGFSVTL